jgi:hypothetical protein
LVIVILKLEIGWFARWELPIWATLMASVYIVCVLKLAFLTICERWSLLEIWSLLRIWFLWPFWYSLPDPACLTIKRLGGSTRLAGGFWLKKTSDGCCSRGN